MRWYCIAPASNLLLIYTIYSTLVTLASQAVYTVLATILLLWIHIEFAILAMATQCGLSAQPAKATKQDKHRRSDGEQDQTNDDVAPNVNFGPFQYRVQGSRSVCLFLGGGRIRERCIVSNIFVVVKV